MGMGDSRIDDPTIERATAEQAAAHITKATGVLHHDVAVVLGSGWAPAADALGTASCELGMDTVVGFTPPTVVGHVGSIRSVLIGTKNVLVFLGRTHLYEGRGVGPVVHGVRTAIAAGAKIVILTNAAGGTQPDMYPGQPVIISDHLNLTATSPIVGGNFIDLTDAYSPRLRQLAKSIDPSLTEGVYAQFPGPHFETPAEVRMARLAGADLVGMSTALEAIAVRAAGAELFGLSLVTNLAAGVSGQALNHAEVLQAGQQAASKLGDFLGELIRQA